MMMFNFYLPFLKKDNETWLLSWSSLLLGDVQKELGSHEIQVHQIFSDFAGFFKSGKCYFLNKTVPFMTFQNL